MRRLEWIVGGLLALFLVLGAGVALVVFTVPPTVEEAEAFTDVTALTAYNLALPVARQWAADASLVNGRATWPEGTDFALERASWGFIFYSPNQAATLLVAVANNQAARLNSQKIDQPPPLVTAGAWQIDSQTAVQLLLNNGGAGFIHTHGGATLTLLLSATNGQAAWEGTFIARETRQTLYFRLDAANGDVLDVQMSE